MKTDENCTLLCGGQRIPKEDAEFINEAIEDHYLINWIVDGLPAAQDVKDDEFTTTGFRLGTIVGEKKHFNNHYELTIDYHQASPNSYRVVGVKVLPKSLETPSECEKEFPKPLILDENSNNVVTFTYSVRWVPSMTPWGTVNYQIISEMGSLP